ncbi:dipeptidyl aminopeptidase/acylaminoacyl peptidase [Kribbella kalugense]|uniref:Dipeptidyl aminopeptidase/acylaminoacyl peptidase n=2 Tax=Kribbella kalugense TaxID=2512221 RepID=A0A4R7ZBQ3_9ACTN|nr:dipeptidyl aminopeptidase/acylaminoacyl peptidase [Kribbella kalugense]
MVARLCQVPVPSGAVISPDGRRIAYVLTTVDEDADRYHRAIWLIDADGGAPRLLTEGSAPKWSPDGRQLAVLQANQLWLIDPDSGDERQLTDRELGAGAAAWAPDGTRIAFSAAVDLPRDDGTAHAASDPVVTRRLGYRSDGIRGYRRPHLFVVEVATGNVEQLTDGDWSAHSPVWSPDGTRLAFAGLQDPRTDNSLSTAPFVLENGEPRRIGTEDMLRALAWDPSGDALLVARMAERSETQPRLLRVPLDGSDAIDLLHGSTLQPPTLTNDGRILTTVNERATTRVYELDPPRPLGDEDLIWITALSAATSRAAIVYAAPDTYGEIATLDLSTGIRKTLTSYTADALHDLDWVRPEPPTFEISDGTTVSGWLLRSPTSERAGEPAPLLLDIHGGPHGWWSPVMQFGHPYQLSLAAAGWSVLLLNPRGSDGFGDDFHAAVYAKQGFGDEADLLEPVDQLVAEGIADPDRLAVAGYSYGGFMTNWLTAHTTRFKAAVTGGGMCDLVSLGGTADVGVGMMDLIYGGTDPAVLRPQSPYESVANVRTPTLILHAVDDDRSPVGQAEQWFAALHTLGVETELVLYPDADHLFLTSGRPSHRLDYARRAITWLTEHLSR